MALLPPGVSSSAESTFPAPGYPHVTRLDPPDHTACRGPVQVTGTFRTVSTETLLEAVPWGCKSGHDREEKNVHPVRTVGKLYHAYFLLSFFKESTIERCCQASEGALVRPGKVLGPLLKWWCC